MIKKVGKIIHHCIHRLDEFTNILSGAIDVIICRQPDGRLVASPFHLKFGKSDSTYEYENKIVRIFLNGKLLPSVCMILDEDGVGYFSSFPALKPQRKKKSKRITRKSRKNQKRRKDHRYFRDHDYQLKDQITEGIFEEILGEEYDFIDNNNIDGTNTPKLFQFPPIDSPGRTNELTSEQLQALDFQTGRNVIEFAVFSRILGWKRVFTDVFLWDSTDKIAIVDIDGTITRTDVMGHVLFFLGTDWAMHGAMKKLLFKLHEANYKIMYLTTRALIMSPQTRNQIRNICGLPDGPSLMTTDTVTRALYRELSKQSFSWKKEKLMFLRNSLNLNFVAGFGNRVWDFLSYQYIGIPEKSIFTQSDGIWKPGIFKKGSNKKVLGQHISYLVDHFEEFF